MGRLADLASFPARHGTGSPANLAQSVEHLIRNEGVASSNLAVGYSLLPFFYKAPGTRKNSAQQKRASLFAFFLAVKELEFISQFSVGSIPTP